MPAVKHNKIMVQSKVLMHNVDPPTLYAKKSQKRAGPHIIKAPGIAEMQSFAAP
jgi:hypothetical protein